MKLPTDFVQKNWMARWVGGGMGGWGEILMGNLMGISQNYRCVSEAEGNTRPSNSVRFTIHFAYDCDVRSKFIITPAPLFFQKPHAFWPTTGVGGKVMKNTCSKKVCVLSHRLA